MDAPVAAADDPTKCKGGLDPANPAPDVMDIEVQAVISVALGLTAFFTFCFLRPRWKTLYAARKRHLDPAIGPPPLPDSMFGWIPALYRISEEQVLSCGGLDAYVFLSFFKMSIRIFLVLLFFAGAVLAPIHHHFEKSKKSGDGSDHSASASFWRQSSRASYRSPSYAYPLFDDADPGDDTSFNPDMGYLWAYLVFTYFFTFLVIWFLNSETFKMIRIRQDYLGTQSTITDRTFRLTGIPKELRNETSIKDLVEKLEIGKVESVTVCRNWGELDALVEQRPALLQGLEESWTKFLNSRGPIPHRATSDPEIDGDPETGGRGRLTLSEVLRRTEVEVQRRAADRFVSLIRPTKRIWYGFLRLKTRKMDAINYYEERLRRLDLKIMEARKKEYDAADIAFVTMDSIAACQMAIQALLDPHPGQLLTKLAPAPSDVVWRNTYAPRSSRRLSSWVITTFIAALSLIWLIPIAWLASLLSLCTINEWWPALSEWLAEHSTIKALVQTGLPTTVVSLLSVAVPYLYEWLSHKQGFLSRGDVELSIISKNFFFNFFNIFLVFTISGTASTFWTELRTDIRDITLLTRHVARAIENLSNFYINFIMLQGLGLFPVRLLEFGSVFTYPFYKYFAKTPRDKAQVDQPPVFSYGFYLPTALLVFILCLVYSVLPDGYLVLILGLVYFTLGYFTYKYQLLYAMEAPRHATGGAWRIISYRVILGLLIFQLVMSGILALQTAFVTAILVVPLLIVTCWYSYYFRRRFEPLTKYISLRSIRNEQHAGEGGYTDEEAIIDGGHGPNHDDVVEAGRQRRLLRRMSTVDEDRERGLRFVNPSLVVTLERPWIAGDRPARVSWYPSDMNPTNGDEQPDLAAVDGPLEYHPPSSSLPDEAYFSRFPPPPVQNYFNRYPPPASTSASAAGPAQGGGGLARAEGGSNSSEVSLGDTHVWREN